MQVKNATSISRDALMDVPQRPFHYEAGGDKAPRSSDPSIGLTPGGSWGAGPPPPGYWNGFGQQIKDTVWGAGASVQRWWNSWRLGSAGPGGAPHRPMVGSDPKITLKAGEELMTPQQIAGMSQQQLAAAIGVGLVVLTAAGYVLRRYMLQPTYTPVATNPPPLPLPGTSFLPAPTPARRQSV